MIIKIHKGRIGKIAMVKAVREAMECSLSAAHTMCTYPTKMPSFVFYELERVIRNINKNTPKEDSIGAILGAALEPEKWADARIEILQTPVSDLRTINLTTINSY